MSKSLKLMMGMLFAVMIVGNALAGGGRSSAQPMSTAENMISHNSQLKPYLPKDVKNLDDTRTGCDANGNTIHDRRYIEASCFTYSSKKTNTSWKIRYTQRGVSEQVFKIQNENLILWASFNKNRENIYASSEAQKFAGIHGNRNTDVAQSPDESGNNEIAQAPQRGRENCAGKNFFEKAACELKNAGVENAVGTIINKSR